jgi:hypothetical protein
MSRRKHRTRSSMRSCATSSPDRSCVHHTGAAAVPDEARTRSRAPGSRRIQHRDRRASGCQSSEHECTGASFPCCCGGMVIIETFERDCHPHHRPSTPTTVKIVSIRHDQNRDLANSSCRASLPLLPDQPRRRSTNQAVPPPTHPQSPPCSTNSSAINPTCSTLLVAQSILSNAIDLAYASPLLRPNRHNPHTKLARASPAGSFFRGIRTPASCPWLLHRRWPPKPFTMSATGSLITTPRNPPFVHRHLAQSRRTLHLRYPGIFHRD